MTQGGGGAWTVAGPHLDNPFSISSFGEDASGELYVVAYSTGAIYRIQETSGTPSPTPTRTRTPTATRTPTRTRRRRRPLPRRERRLRRRTPTRTATPSRRSSTSTATGHRTPLTDGILVLRWFFAFRGDPLVAGATGSNCERCTAPEIEGYLASISGDLDIDGDGVEQPLSDGILIVRWLLGFRGQSLISGAVAEGCTRCTAGAIESFLGGM